MNKVRFVYSLAASTAVLLASSFHLSAADYAGADVVLKQAATVSPDKTPPNPGNADSVKNLSSDLRAFRLVSATLAPDEAANRWLALADRIAKMPRSEMQRAYQEGIENIGLGTLVESLPPPAAWDTLAKVLEARPEGKDADALRARILRLTIHWLTQNRAAEDKDLAAFGEIFGKVQHANRFFETRSLTELQSLLLRNSDDGKAILANLTKQLDLYEDAEVSGSRSLEVPDLVSMVGVKAATEFLKKALKTEHIQLRIDEGVETQKLARKLALQMVTEMKSPQWSLAQTLDSAALFEAMAKRFPKSDNDDSGKQTAQTYYLLGLISAKRTTEAVAVAKQLGEQNVSLPEEGIWALEKMGQTRAVSDFLHDLLEQNPNLSFWNDYVDVAPQAGDSVRMIVLAEAASHREGMTPKQHRMILHTLARAYLAADDVQKGIDLMRKQIAETAAMTADESNDSDNGAASSLAELGVALERRELVDEGIQAMRDSLNRMKGTRGREKISTLRQMARLLAKTHRGVEAESVIAEELRILQQPAAGEPMDYYSLRQTLCELMALYYVANRPADVLAVLDRAPFWGAKDLRELYVENVNMPDGNDDCAGFFAAWALAASGRKDEALPIVETLLEKKGGYDPAYELLLQIAPDKAMEKLDALFARDPFEERPLIWKAKLLLGQGKLEEAEKCARQAITIDPTDGEQGPGRRLRAYATLGEIREARGDKKEADFLKEVLVSVRNSDHGDQLHSAGLVTRALKVYEEALTHFADAYCIQARLAFRMAELGDMAGAEEHYRRAYELMPDSFGRVESYCFGCEGAFRGPQAQGIAEQVFTKIAEKNPEKPQIHYLLGYLRDEQNRYSEALPEFRKAVKLDPDYLNAWKMLASAAAKVRLPSAERDAIELNLLRLDPLGRHSSFDFDRISDLRAAWTAMDAAAKLNKPTPESLYPLAASAGEIERQQKEAAGNPRAQRNRIMLPSQREDEERDPRKKIARQQLVYRLNNWFMQAPQYFRD